MNSDKEMAEIFFNELVEQEKARLNLIEMVKKNNWPKDSGSTVNYKFKDST